jgi:predicted transcriptional regulator
MRTNSDEEYRVVKLLGSGSRAKILSLLLTHTGQPFYQREIMYETGLSLQPVQRELRNLVVLGIIKRQITSNRVYYQVNTASPLFKPLQEICNLFSDEG